jgi:dUTP pyrophosphatase
MKILKVKDVKTPERGTKGSAGIDMFIPNDFTPLTIQPGESTFIPSGIKASIPSGYALVAMNKSGIAAKRSMLVGACLIDEDYQGEMHIDLKNVGTQPQTLNPGDKIVQVVCLPINYVEVEEVHSEHELFGDVVTERGDGGFGSTGTK